MCFHAAKPWALAVACALLSASVAPAKDGAPALECFSNAQTRQQIAQHRLVEPFLAMQTARGAGQDDPIFARLCANGEGYYYEIGLLRHDGHTVKVYVDAASGKARLLHVERQIP
jgi:hypothetical protein